jgi:hypothetical protein
MGYTPSIGGTTHIRIAFLGSVGFPCYQVTPKHSHFLSQTLF